MFKYIKIDAALNYVSDTVRDHVDESRILQWIYDGYKNNVKISNIKYEYYIGFVEIKNHQALLPKDMLKLYLACYSRFKNDANNYREFSNSYIRDYTEDGDKIILAQGHILNTLKTDYHFRPMKFTGQNNDLIHNNCYKIYDDCCFVNYSFDKQMKVIRTTEEEGYVMFVYMSNPKNESGRMLIPDDTVLLTALGKYAEQQYLNMKRMQQPSKYGNLYMQVQREANQWFQQFIATYKLENLDVFALSEVMNDNSIMYSKSYRKNDRTRW